MKKILLFAFIFLISFSPLFADQDVSGSKDHPLVTRFPESHIIHYENKNYDEYRLPLGKVIDKKHTNFQSLEGKITRIIYNAKEKSTIFEVFKSFESALNSSGSKILFSCSKEACGEGWLGATIDLNQLNLKYGQDDISAQFGHASTGHLIVAKLSKGSQDIFIAMTIATGWHRYPSILIDIIEVKQMQKNLVKLTPDALFNEIMQKGYTSIYGINFDSGKAIVKNNSNESIKKIATILRKDSSLNIYVVGHTDDTGNLEQNMQLSTERAKAIIKELINKYKINSSRLQPHGVGPLVPVDTNTTDEGRLKNRRVGLVQSLHSFGPNKVLDRKQQVLEQRKRMEDMKKRRQQMLERKKKQQALRDKLKKKK